MGVSDSITMLLIMEARDAATAIIKQVTSQLGALGTAMTVAAAQAGRSSAEIEIANTRAAASAASYERAIAAQTEAQAVLRASMTATADAQVVVDAAVRGGALTIQQAAVIVTAAAEEEEAALMQLQRAESLVATRSAEMAEAQRAASTSSGMGAAALSTAGAAAGIAAVAMGIVGYTSIKSAAEFQSSTTRLVTSAGEIQANLEKVRSGMLTMAGDVGYSTEALSTAMYKVESGMGAIDNSSTRAASALTILKASAEGAKTENADLTVVADAVTSAMVDYKFKASDASDVTSKLVAATSQGKMTFQELAGSLSSVLPVASAAGIKLDDVLGVLASMTVHGMSAQQATQNMADAIRHLETAATSNVQSNQLALIGIDARQLSADLGQKGLSGVLAEITTKLKAWMPPGSDKVIMQMQTALKGLNPEVQALGQKLMEGTISLKDYRTEAKNLDPIAAQQALSFATLAGQTHKIGSEQVSGTKVMQDYSAALRNAMGDATGMNVALMTSGDNAKITEGAIGAISNATSEAGGHVKGWAEIQQTLNYKLDALKGKLEGTKIVLGTALLPMVSTLIDKVTALLGPITEWISHHSQLAAGILATVVAIGTVVVAGYAFAKMLEVARVAMVALRIATIAEDGALVANPIGLVVLALAALAAGIWYCWNHFEGFRKVVTECWDAIKTASLWAWNNALKPAFEGIRTAIMEGVVPAAIWLWHALQAAWSGIVTGTLWLWHALQAAWSGIQEAVAATWSFLKAVWGAIQAAVRDLGAAFTWLWRNVVDPAWQGIKATVGLAWSGIKFIWSGIQMEIRTLAAVFTWLWKNVIDPVWQGIKLAVSIAWTFIKITWGLIQIEIKLLAAVFIWLWKNAILPAWDGIKVAIGVAWDGIKVIWGLVQEGLKTVGGWFTWLWKNVIDPVWQGIKLAIGVAWEGIKVVWGYIQEGLKTVGGWFTWLWQNVIIYVWDGIKIAIGVAWEGIKAIWGLIQEGLKTVGGWFTWLWHAIEGVWSGIVSAVASAWSALKGVFSALGGYITNDVVPAFRAGVTAIGKAWDGLVDLAKKPVEFLVNTVINGGIIDTYNVLAKAFHVGTVDHVSLPKGWATGGHIVGAGTGTSDSILAMLSNGEYVIPANKVADYGVNFFDALIGTSPHTMKYPGDGSGGLPAFAGGGLVGDVWNAIMHPEDLIKGPVNALINRIPGGGMVRDVLVGAGKKALDGLLGFAGGGGGSGAGAALAFLKAQDGKPYVWAAAGPGGYDCSGIVSAVYNVMHGKSPYSHTFSTSNEAGFFPKPGMGLLTAGWTNPGEPGPGGNNVGHTAGILAGLPFESTGSGGVHMGSNVTPVTAFAHVGTFDRGGPIYPGLNLVHNGTGGMEYVGDPQAARGPTVVIDLRGSQVMSDRDIDLLLTKIDQRLVRTLLPSAGMQVRR